MYLWYKNSDICYAYLSDVAVAFEVDNSSGVGVCVPPEAFKRSKWFTRGWTLQELIAPSTVEFYTMSWEEIGTKQSLRDEIVRITGVASGVFQGYDLSEYHVAEKMSWAASRITTRVEDMSYCLLGIFDIHIPLLYGEGKRAFIRLQEEILRTTDDFTILARGFNLCFKFHQWTPLVVAQSLACPLATAISEFSMAGLPNEERYSNLKLASRTLNAWGPTENGQKEEPSGSVQQPRLLTAKGLFVTLPMYKISDSLSLAYLHCELFTSGEIVCMVLTETIPGQYQRVGTGPLGYQYYRFMRPEKLSCFKLTSFYMEQKNIPRSDVDDIPVDPRPPCTLPLVLDIETTNLETECRFYVNRFEWPAEPSFEETQLPKYWPSWNSPEVLCVLGNCNNLVLGFGHGENDQYWTSDRHYYWCRCILVPPEEMLHVPGLNNSAPASKWWHPLLNFFPTHLERTDRVRGTLQTGTEAIFVSIREYPPVPSEHLERRVVAKVRIEKL